MLKPSDNDVFNKMEFYIDIPKQQGYYNSGKNKCQKGAVSLIITVANMKGGVGKSTSAVILAEMAAQQGLRTLFVDMDTQRNGYKKVTTENEEGKYEPAFSQLAAVICDTAAPDPALLRQYDVVVVDTPPRADAGIIRKVLSLTDAVVTPFQMGDDEITGIAELFEILPGDKDLLVFPLHIVSPMESSSDKGLEDDAQEFFEQYGLDRGAILEWPMRKTIKNNIAKKKPYHFSLTEKDKGTYKKVFNTIMKNLREVSK